MAWPYDYRWQKASKAWLCAHPLCVLCEKRGRVTAAQVVDHIKAHKNDMALFWDTGNWQSLCKPCHDSLKQRIEKSGPGMKANGMPLDPKHHWNRGG